MDRLNELSNIIKGKVENQQLSNANFRHLSSRKITVKNYKGAKLTINEYGDIYAIDLRIEADFAFSINNPDRVMIFKEPLDIADFAFKVYIRNEKESPFLNATFVDFWKVFSGKINDIQLVEDEGLFFRRNGIEFALHSSRNLLPIIDDMLLMINSHDNIFKKNYRQRIFVKNIPYNLLPLHPLLKKWAVADDTERNQLIEDASELQKKRLIKTVDPYFTQINEFLNSSGDYPLSYEATLIGSLAELVSELKITI